MRTFDAISLRRTACEMPMVFIQRIPSKLEAALSALDSENAVEFTRALERAARLHDTARAIIGNVATVSKDSLDDMSGVKMKMMLGVLDDFKHVVFAVRAALVRDQNNKYMKVEETDSKDFFPFDISDSQVVEAVRSTIGDLATTMQLKIW